ncbi:unnamed protein product [Cuscuta campestris]|uniref:Uncharacterized protein n=1 Tax=Cuscuta campestris TaxID=132261 RepID=A0A484KQN8_9ASTE|nr:unnamed protein product [Cuscuta campestris]
MEESSATSKAFSEERRKAIEAKEAVELWKMVYHVEKQLDAQNPYRQAVFNEEMLARAKYLALKEEDDEAPVHKEKKGGQPVGEGRKRKDFGRGTNPTGYQASRPPVHVVQSLPAPPRSWESYSVQDAPKYCEYHRNGTHNTSECVTLKKEMDQLIARRLPPRAERQAPGNMSWRRPAAAAATITNEEGKEHGRQHLGRDCEDLDEDERQNQRHLGCRFIMGGNTGGDSASSRKKWKKMVHLAKVQRPPLPKQKRKEPLVFTDEDYPLVLSPHRDALVVKVEINNVVVHRTLVDTGNLVNIMYNNIFKELACLERISNRFAPPLSGFTWDTIEAEGTITVKAGATGSGRFGVRNLPRPPMHEVRYPNRGDMPGVDSRIICHRLAMDLAHKPVKQKKRFLSSERRDFVTKEVPRDENAEADILSKLGLESLEYIRAMTQEEELLDPSISPRQVLIITANEPDRIDELTMYILEGSLPTDPVAAKEEGRGHSLCEPQSASSPDEDADPRAAGATPGRLGAFRGNEGLAEGCWEESSGNSSLTRSLR